MDDILENFSMTNRGYVKVGAGIRNGRLKVYFDASFLAISSGVIVLISMSTITREIANLPIS